MAIIVSRTNPKWVRAEQHAQCAHGKTLDQLGWEGHVLHAIERGEDPVRVCHQLALDQRVPSTQERSS